MQAALAHGLAQGPRSAPARSGGCDLRCSAQEPLLALPGPARRYRNLESKEPQLLSRWIRIAAPVGEAGPASRPLVWERSERKPGARALANRSLPPPGWESRREAK